jgi:hypothetical protein
MTLNDAADLLPLMQLSRFGIVLPIDGIDLVECEDGESVMAYCFDAAENCVILLLDKPLDADHARSVLLKPRMVH